jgi:hypothetical protein
MERISLNVGRSLMCVKMGNCEANAVSQLMTLIVDFENFWNS